MPYRHAHWWVLTCLAVIVAGFWPTYWSVVGTSPWQFHLHGIVATVWVMMVAAQVWTAHNKKLPIHRATGRASLYLFPFLIMGLFGIGLLNAERYVGGESPVLALYGDTFFFGLWVAVAAYVTLFYRAMKYRRKVWVHSAYLLGTPMILFESPASRILLNHVPAFAILGPQDFHKILDAILVTDAMMVVLALAFWWRARKRSQGFAVVAGFVALQMVAMAAAFYLFDAGAMVAAFAALPMPVVMATGLALGAATSWLGWQAGKTPAKVPPVASPVAA